MQPQHPLAARTLALAAAGLAALSALPARGKEPAARAVFSAEDPAGDATGTGRYTMPASSEFRDADFDLRRFSVSVDGEEAVFEVALGSAVRAPPIGQRTNAIPLGLSNGIYLQNIDIYIDRERNGEGHPIPIPGRRVAFPEGQAWQRAIVLAPQPGAVRSVLDDTMGPAARDVVVPRVEARGRVVFARVALAALGGRPDASWAWAVHVSEARWERTFEAFDRLRGTREPDAYTLPVVPIAEPYAFGGGPVGRFHPQVLDVLLPADADQARALSSFHAGGDLAGCASYARVPFVVGGPAGMRIAVAPPVNARAAEASKQPGAPPSPAAGPGGQAPALSGSGAAGLGDVGTRQTGTEARPTGSEAGSAGAETRAAGAALVVADAAGDMISVRGPSEDVRPFQIGTVVDGTGNVLGRVVVVRVLEGGFVANVVETREKITAGARVRFEAPAQAHREAP